MNEIKGILLPEKGVDASARSKSWRTAAGQLFFFQTASAQRDPFDIGIFDGRCPNKKGQSNEQDIRDVQDTMKRDFLLYWKDKSC